MNAIYWLLGAIVVLVAGFYALSGYRYDTEEQDTPLPTMNEQPEIIPIEHATGIIHWGETAIYFDPTGEAAAFAGQPPANIVLVTDIHGDHLSTSTLAAVVGAQTQLVVPQAVRDQLPVELAARATILENGQSLDAAGFRITAVPMYNLPDAENADRHTKGRGNGYIIERNGTRVYIAGDTAGTPEMRSLADIDIAFVPMNLPYTMGVEEAADAVLTFKPRTVYPYHYRGQNGLADVQHFRQLVNTGDPGIEVVLANWYPEQ